MEHRKYHLVGYGLALIGCLTISASFILSESLVLSEVAPIVLLVLGNAVALVFGLRNVFTKTESEYDLEHSFAYRVVNVGAVIITVTSGLLIFVVGIVSLGVFG
ncbi:hypothetical protein halTADL_3115 [Halohasta litchfieldiae]|jgi:hypothetical protein|uniref:Uncharacterized protein n=1 Tax=Halohasta litchfieldiae TaxID=1073996 RepID=A0A1H6R917_9EURY|nr:hypothetical protein [Halohasta litchfieldiae]ATW89817.1 hypothetical protein halTADL_3115 [Halohasta litchfieldiae]SEI52253.1 hypothetical protein SAMN05444271_1029 [Halohasta litchfieldiae]